MNSNVPKRFPTRFLDRFNSWLRIWCDMYFQLELEFAKGSVRAVISDNGRGFELSGRLDDLPRSGKLGLTGIQERARLLGGTLEVNSVPGKGTTLVVEAPI